MAISTAISRVAEFYRRHGFVATVRRAGVEVKRVLFSGRSVLFYCDLATQISPPPALPDNLKVERKKSSEELSPEDREAMTSVGDPKLVQQNMRQRFELGASLWLIRCHDKLAGYMWTLRGCTAEPHYFPFGPDDVQFLDLHVFPKFRGRAIDWFLTTHIFHTLAAEGLGRAFGEVAEWNRASLSATAMTPFRRLGLGRKLTIFGRTIVFWDKGVSNGQNVHRVSLRGRRKRMGMYSAPPEHGT
jgi:hypothetical protein